MSLEFNEELHKYKYNGVIQPSVTHILSAVGLSAFVHDEASMHLGNIVHKMVEDHERGKLDESALDSAFRGYLDSWRLFKKDHDYKTIWVEKPLYSVLGYCGKPDGFGTIKKEYVVLDLKTGEIGWIVGIQTAGYKQLIIEDFKKVVPIRRIGIHLRANGSYTMKEFYDYEDWTAFQAALTVVNYRRRKGEVLK